MSAQSMLEQLLKSGLAMVESNTAGNAGTSGQQPVASDAGWGKFGAGAAAGGLAGLLLGSKRGRKIGGSALKYGSMAALGVVAFKAYSNWQAQQQQSQTVHKHPLPATAVPAPPQQLPSAATEQRSQALLKAMIAAAKSDGHLDQHEHQLIQAELSRLGGNEQDHAWMEAELARPTDPSDVAQAATTPELAAEMYFASLLVTDETSFMERAYLDELARQLQLAPELKAALETQAKAL